MFRQALALGTALLCATPAFAAPADYVYTPQVTPGEREIDFKFGTSDKSGEDRFTATSLGFGYGMNATWFTEFYVKYEKLGSEDLHLDAFEWENRFQLTEPGEYPVDFGFVTEIEKPQDTAEGWEIRMGPLFQKEVGRVQLNANLLVEGHYNARENIPTTLGYQLQARYRWRPLLDFGVQGFGEMGQWNHWDAAHDQTHRFGPAIFGKLALGGGRAFTYNAGWLFGVASGAPDNTFRMQVEYEF